MKRAQSILEYCLVCAVFAAAVLGAALLIPKAKAGFIDYYNATQEKIVEL